MNKHSSFLKGFHVFIHERHRQREAETQAEGEAGPLQGVRCGTPSQVSRITPWAEGGTKQLSHPGCPRLLFEKKQGRRSFLLSSQQTSSKAGMELQGSAKEWRLLSCALRGGWALGRQVEEAGETGGSCLYWQRPMQSGRQIWAALSLEKGRGRWGRFQASQREHVGPALSWEPGGTRRGKEMMGAVWACCFEGSLPVTWGAPLISKLSTNVAHLPRGGVGDLSMTFSLSHQEAMK